jgi:hypothetical protein
MICGSVEMQALQSIVNISRYGQQYSMVRSYPPAIKNTAGDAAEGMFLPRILLQSDAVALRRR